MPLPQTLFVNDAFCAGKAVHVGFGDAALAGYQAGLNSLQAQLQAPRSAVHSHILTVTACGAVPRHVQGGALTEVIAGRSQHSKSCSRRALNNRASAAGSSAKGTADMPNMF